MNHHYETRWSELNRRLLDAMQREDCQEMISLYNQMAAMRCEEGGPFRNILEQSHKSSLKLLKIMKIDKVKVFPSKSGDCCEACAQINGEVFTVEEAMRNMLLPVKQCSTHLNGNGTKGWCRCCYLPFLEETVQNHGK